MPNAPTHHRRTPTRAVAAVVIGVALASCSMLTNDSASPPPPLTRDVSGVTTTTVDRRGRRGRGRIHLPAGPAAADVQHRLAADRRSHRRRHDHRAGRLRRSAGSDTRPPSGTAQGRPRPPHRRAGDQQRRPGCGSEFDGPQRVELVPVRAHRPVRHRVVGSTRHGRVRRIGRLHRRRRATTTSSPSRTSLPTTMPSGRRTSTTPRSSPSGASTGSITSRRSERTTPPAISMRSVRRSTNPSSRTSGSATAASSVGCGRRCSRRPSELRCSTARPIRPPTRWSGPRTNGSDSRTPSTRSSPSAAGTATACFTATATRRVRSTI